MKWIICIQLILEFEDSGISGSNKMDWCVLLTCLPFENKGWCSHWNSNTSRTSLVGFYFSYLMILKLTSLVFHWLVWLQNVFRRDTNLSVADPISNMTFLLTLTIFHLFSEGGWQMGSRDLWNHTGDEFEKFMTLLLGNFPAQGPWSLRPQRGFWQGLGRKWKGFAGQTYQTVLAFVTSSVWTS